MVFPAGSLVYHNYRAPQVMYTRLVLGHITGHEHIIYIPDDDTYAEVLDQSNPDLVGFYMGPDDGSLALGVAAMGSGR